MHKQQVHGVETVKPGDLVGMRADLKKICKDFPNLAKSIDLWALDRRSRIGCLTVDSFVIVLKANDQPWVHVLMPNGKEAWVLQMMISKLN